MEKTITIDGVEITLKSSGATPKWYREIFKKDLFIEFAKLQKYFTNGKLNDDIAIEEFDFSIVENLAYTMAYQHDRTIGTQFEWLDKFEHSGAIMDSMDEILEVYIDGLQTTSNLKKKIDQPSEK